jgi:hypothetical protein
MIKTLSVNFVVWFVVNWMPAVNCSIFKFYLELIGLSNAEQVHPILKIAKITYVKAHT